MAPGGKNLFKLPQRRQEGFDVAFVCPLSLGFLQSNLVAKILQPSHGVVLPGLGGACALQMGTMVLHCPLVDSHALMLWVLTV